MIDLSKTVGTLLERLEQIRVERPSAGTKYRLMGIALDIGELSQQMKDEVLEKVSREIVLDADADIDYGEMSQHILTKELEENAVQDEIRVQQGVVNQALAALSDMMDKIATQLTRHRHDEEYAKLYETEYRRYMSSGAARRSRQTFEEWRDNECGGHPSREDIEDYRLEKVLQMFSKGVFDSQVEHIQRAKRYPGELDFDLPGDQTKISKTVFHHYAALRRIVDFKDGSLVVNPASTGRYFYAHRHDENAKAHRTAFLKYMHKVDMAQQELHKLMQKEGLSASYGLCHEEAETQETELFHFIHPEIEEEEAMRIHDAVKRLVKHQKVPEICAYLKELKQEKKLLLPQSPTAAYKELQRMGMPSSEGYGEKHFSSCYMK